MPAPLLIADAGEYLQLISNSSSLEFLSIVVSAIPQPQELYSFLTTVHQSCFRDILTTVLLMTDYAAVALDAPPPYSPRSAHSFTSPLLCSNLEHISLYIRYGQEAIDNSLMKDMALRWPRLRSISLSSTYRDSRWHLSANLEGLVYLAQHCRMLELVNCQFDVSLPTTSVDPASGIRNESLTGLYVHRSRIIDPVAVATLLSDVFPNLRLDHDWHFREGLGRYDSDDDEEDDPEFIEMCKRWKAVDQMLEMRKQEVISYQTEL